MSRWERALLVLIGMGMIVGGIALGIHRGHVHGRCIENGGHIVRVDCAVVCMGDPLVCQESCDEECRGANADEP